MKSTIGFSATAVLAHELRVPHWEWPISHFNAQHAMLTGSQMAFNDAAVALGIWCFLRWVLDAFEVDQYDYRNDPRGHIDLEWRDK